MPEALTYLYAYAASSAGVAVGSTALVAAGYVTTAALVVGYSNSQRRSAQRRARNAYNASLTDRQVSIRSGVEPRRILYGTDRVTGPIIFAHSSGAAKEYLHLVVPLGAHEFDAYEKLYFNDVELPALDSGGFVTSGPFCKTIKNTDKAFSVTNVVTLAHTPSRILSVTAQFGSGDGVSVTEPSYTVAGNVVTASGVGGSNGVTVNYEWEQVEPLVRIKTYLGAASQTADADLIAESGGKWTSAHRGDGVPYLYIRLKYDQEVFGQVGIPQPFARARGRKVLDTRTGTTAWSDNWALCCADYLKNTQWGLGSTAAQVPTAEVNAAANISDETVTLSAGGATQKRYTVNGSLSTADGQRDNLEDLLAAGAGAAVWVQGRWLLRAGAHRSPDATLDASWLAEGTIQLVPTTQRADLFNAVSGTFIDPAQGYAEAQIPVVKNATYETADGGRRKVRNLTMPLVNDSLRAQRLAKIELERARMAYTITVTCNLRAYDTLPTQVLTVSLPRYGSNQLMEVRRREYDPTTGIVRLVLRKTAATVWDWAYGEATTTTPVNTTLPSWATPPAELAGLAVDSTSGVQLEQSTGAAQLRALVSWTQSAEVFVLRGGTIEIEAKVDNSDQWTRFPPLPGDATSTYIQPLEQLRKTLVRVRQVNSAGRSSPWAYKLHTPQSVVAITTNQTAADLATKTQQARHVDGAVVSSAPDFNVIVTSTLNTVSWTNNTAATVPVQVEHNVFGRLTNAGAGTGSGWFEYEYSVSSGGGAGSTASPLMGLPGAAEQPFPYNDTINVGAGLTLTVTLLARAVVTSGTSVTNNYRQPTTRVTAIKR